MKTVAMAAITLLTCSACGSSHPATTLAKGIGKASAQVVDGEETYARKDNDLESSLHLKKNEDGTFTIGWRVVNDPRYEATVVDSLDLGKNFTCESPTLSKDDRFCKAPSQVNGPTVEIMLTKNRLGTFNLLVSEVSPTNDSPIASQNRRTILNKEGLEKKLKSRVIIIE